MVQVMHQVAVVVEQVEQVEMQVEHNQEQVLVE